MCLASGTLGPLKLVKNTFSVLVLKSILSNVRSLSKLTDEHPEDLIFNRQQHGVLDERGSCDLEEARARVEDGIGGGRWNRETGCRGRTCGW